LKALYNKFYEKFLGIYGSCGALKCATSEIYKILLYRRLGCFSMTTNNKNILLWNCYTANKGFCVEFAVEKFPFRYSGPFPMHYTNLLNPVFVDCLQTATLLQTNLKTKDWEYEDEWRLLIHSPSGLDFNCWDKDCSCENSYNFGGEHNRKMRYPMDSIKSVTLGEWFFRGPNIRCYPITLEETEIVFLNKKEPMQCQVLDFLKDKKLAVYKIKNNLGVLEVQPVEIVKLQNRVYRIINKK